MANRGWLSCKESNSGMVCTSVTGISRSIEETNRLTSDSRLAGSTEVRTAEYRQHQFGTWLAGRYITGDISSWVAECRILPTTPTMVRNCGPPAAWLTTPGFSFFPTAFSPEKYCC